MKAGKIDPDAPTRGARAKATKELPSTREMPRPMPSPAGEPAPPRPSRELRSGELLAGGRFRIVDRLGTGGMGAVYAAEDLTLKKRVALKFRLINADESHREATQNRGLFLDEARKAQEITHNNVCRIFDVHESRDLEFISMEYIEGEDLGRLLRRVGRLPEERVIEMGCQICEGLEAIHARGLFHQDLKPGNVMIDGDGRAKISDLGLAGTTCHGWTPQYMAPEQRRERRVSAQSDLYSLGLVLYEMVTGERAFKKSCLDDPPPRPPREAHGEVRPEIEAIILECLRPADGDRPASAREVAEALSGQVRPRRLWNVPERNAFFTGREEILAELHRALAAPDPAIQVLAGLGGVGKTQTAIEYAHRYRDDYEAVLWVRAATRAEARSDLVDLAGLIGLPEATAREQDEVLAALKRWLGRQSGWFLIFDNIDRPEILEPLLPTKIRGRILLTSRAQNFSPLGIRRPLTMPLLPPEEAMAFLVERVERDLGEAERAAAAELAEELGYLPLALEQAAAYIAETEISLMGYLKSYRHQPLRHLEKAQPETGDYLSSVAKTWALNFDQVGRAAEAAADLLHAGAFLAPDAIPLELVEKGAAKLGPALARELDGAEDDPARLHELLAHLRRFSLIQRDIEAQTFSVHRLVQVVARDEMNDETLRLWITRSVAALASSFPWPRFEQWQRCERLYPHVQEVAEHLDRLARRPAADEREPYLEAVALLNKAGWYAYTRARYDEAEPLYRQALAIRERLFGREHPDVPKSLNNLAILYADQGRYKEAEPLYRRALEIREKKLGPEHPDVARSLNNLANFLLDQGRHEDAEPLYRRALEIREKKLGPEHLDVARSLNNLANSYLNQGRHKPAEPLYRRALEIRENKLGEDHPEVATSLNNLANLYLGWRRPKAAEPLYRRALEIREKKLGPEHPDVAKSLNNLANFYFDQNRHEAAEPLYLRSLGIREKQLGAEHPIMARSLNNLAALYHRQGRHAEAEPLYLRALEIRRAQLGEDHPDTARSQDSLAHFYMFERRYDEARELQQRAREVAERTLGTDHPLCRQIRRRQRMIESSALRPWVRAFLLVERYFWRKAI